MSVVNTMNPNKRTLALVIYENTITIRRAWALLRNTDNSKRRARLPAHYNGKGGLLSETAGSGETLIELINDIDP